MLPLTLTPFLLLLPTTATQPRCAAVATTASAVPLRSGLTSSRVLPRSLHRNLAQRGGGGTTSAEAGDAEATSDDGAGGDEIDEGL